ncbi:DUF4280 domain-containing protein [Paenibacillus chitinolyticus]|uniref:DUF4280 domain-containing protein n=1 Tax=Paenibacillus chitinolyticus TaxID=79263 RepID=UPI002DBE5045|nr:DUF4280 domain-containing protein [Paenibacillus chitinolyticus]MEC0245991.1 DUF4280 domain-containing protein [Paenibacillus chitinolyticus]
MTGPRYVVRGAYIQCQYGTHKRHINLPNSHGSYVNEKPMMNEEDFKPDNISHFGICTSPLNQSGETIYLISESGETISGKPCLPSILAKWTYSKETTKVAGKPALTTDSELHCELQGVIKFLNDGQHDN